MSKLLLILLALLLPPDIRTPPPAHERLALAAPLDMRTSPAWWWGSVNFRMILFVVDCPLKWAGLTSEALFERSER